LSASNLSIRFNKKKIEPQRREEREGLGMLGSWKAENSKLPPTLLASQLVFL
jgi:hypothetical protein